MCRYRVYAPARPGSAEAEDPRREGADERRTARETPDAETQIVALTGKSMDGSPAH